MMETIRVNMTPCEDVQTIHASQNDGEARQWEFELHNNGELIDTSEVTDQIVFKAYKGGTEQLLPENTSTPTTSPFLGNIRYPQGLLTDQEFTYRQSPTESNGLAKITDIKGNTLVWNQLVQNGNFADTSNWTPLAGVSSISAYNNTCTINFNASNQYNKQIEQNSIQFLYGHTYLFFATVKSNVENYQHARFRYLGNASEWFDCSAETTITLKFVCTSSGSGFAIGFDNGLYSGTATVKNVMIIDITQLNVSYITDATTFRQYYNLPYYAYNQGTLLSFNGNGIKTVGKNRFYYPYTATSQTLSGVQCTIDTDGKITLNGTATSSFYINIFPNYPQNRVKQLKGTYTLGIGHTTIPNNFEFNFGVVINGAEYPSYGGRISSYNAKLTKDIPYDWEMFCNMRILQGASFDNFVIKPMLNFGNEALTFEPYTSSTLSLPISTYFPNGMKSAGNVYDELTPSKAITRIGSVDLGTITYTYDGECFIGQLPSDAKVLSANTETLNSVSDRYLINNWSSVKYLKSNMTLGTGVNRYICIFNSSYTDPSAFKTAMDGIPLYFELATPTETSFTTASLVTENAEIPLSNEDGTLIGKCTEQLSAEPGFHDAKIKLADGDGECYSNKIQLHIERRPQ